MKITWPSFRHGMRLIFIPMLKGSGITLGDDDSTYCRSGHSDVHSSYQPWIESKITN